MYVMESPVAGLGVEELDELTVPAIGTFLNAVLGAVLALVGSLLG